jgi:hypothetical protein
MVKFAIRWIIASGFGFGVGVIGGAGVILILGRMPIPIQDRSLTYAVLICIGVAVGLAQTWAIKGVLPLTRHWLPATLIGYLLSIIAVWFPRYPILANAGLLDDGLIFILMGSLIGLVQWVVLRQRLSRAGWWVPASAASFLPFLWLVAHPVSTFRGSLLTIALLGGLGAIPTGFMLAWLLRRTNAVTASGSAAP